MKLVGLNTTEWWMLREQIKEILIDPRDHRMEDGVYKLVIADQAGQEFELHLELGHQRKNILSPSKVIKL